jgi:hypothetical protein
MNKKIPFSYWVIGICLIAFCYYYFNNSNSKAVDYKVTSHQIYNEYADNEVAANAKYKGKIIEVTGVLISFTTTMGTNYCYVGSPGDIIGEVSCAMSEEFSKQAGNYTIGQPITVKGTCTGKEIFGVVDIR